MAEYRIWEPLQCKSVFNTYLSLGRSNQKVEESGLAFFWPNWSSSDLPNPNTNTQTHKHTNTQIQHITKCQKNPPCGIFLRLKFPAAPAAQITRKTKKYNFTKYKINKSKNHYLSKVMLMTMLRWTLYIKPDWKWPFCRSKDWLLEICLYRHFLFKRP